MSATDTKITLSDRFPASTVVSSRAAVILMTVGSVVAVNLLIYLLGRALGGSFIYVQTGKPTHVDAVAVTVMSAVPLTIGLTLVASLARSWPVLPTIAKVVAPMAAVATIFLMTIPARFDIASTVCLAIMHLIVALVTVVGVAALAPQR